jgi:hypothetical protein
LILRYAANRWRRKTESGFAIMEKLEDFCLALSYLLAQGCGKSPFGRTNAQAFAFGGEPNIKVMEIRDKFSDTYNSISSRSLF